MGAIVIATTRPETMFGDVAIAVSPNDYKYKAFGSGALKITPAHDPNDFEVGIRHNLPQIKIIDEKGCMMRNEYVPPQLQGVTREKAREMTVEMLEKNGALLRIQKHVHNVGKCQRCSTTIEPLLSQQWFVKMEPLARPAIEAVKNGSIKFIPQRWEKNYLMWMENIRDWCISRQLWWGHQIPAYYHNQTGEMVVALENPDPANYTQETDVLDTWFSSGLWPFETMGWPDTNHPDYKKFYPTNTLVTGFDIIFFWVARMITMGLEFTKQPPFSTVYIHGLIRDEHGQKMSKSKGNTIDPVDLIEKYGCDALRFTLTHLCTYGGQDIKISDEKFEFGRNFANKIWNASRFVLMNLTKSKDELKLDLNNLTIADKWILNELNEVAKIVNENLENYRIGEVASILYDFFWNKYCDWYIELSKIEKNEAVLVYVLEQYLKLLHPIMPHITEAIWQKMPISKDTIGILNSVYPKYNNELCFSLDSEKMETVFETIKALRNLRAEFNVPLSSKIDIIIDKNEELYSQIIPYLNRLAKVEKVTFETNANTAKSAYCTVGETKITVPLADLIDLNQEIARQQKKIDKLEIELKSIDGRLSNEKFVSSAPKEVVQKAKDRKDELLAEINLIKETIKKLS